MLLWKLKHSQLATSNSNCQVVKWSNAYLPWSGDKCIVYPVSCLHFAYADVNTATCSDCASGTCPNPILPNILKEKKLTSGYMGIFSSAKPKGITGKRISIGISKYIDITTTGCADAT